MNRPVDPVTDDDLSAYVDDQLDVARRIDVEAYLSQRPEAASRVMADLRIRDELRLALADAPRSVMNAPARVATVEAARRLERALGRVRVWRQLRAAAAVALLLGAGWFAHAQIGPFGVSEVVASDLAPAYVDAAVMAHRTVRLRAAMPSQSGSGAYDPADIRAATAIVMPELPKGWSVTDVQVFPSSFGPSVELVLEAEGLGKASLFAVRPGSFDVVPATVAMKDPFNAAYWQIGEVAYALVAEADTDQLDQVASKLARSLY